MLLLLLRRGASCRASRYRQFLRCRLLLCSALLYVLCLLYCRLLCYSACSAVPSSSRRQRRRRCCRRRCCCCCCCRCCCVRTTNALLSVCMVLTPFFRYYSPPMPTDCVLRVSADIYLSTPIFPMCGALVSQPIRRQQKLTWPRVTVQSDHEPGLTCTALLPPSRLSLSQILTDRVW